MRRRGSRARRRCAPAGRRAPPARRRPQSRGRRATGSADVPNGVRQWCAGGPTSSRSSSSARPSATCRSLRSSARAAGVDAHEMGTSPRSRPVTNTTCHSRPLARWNVTRSTPCSPAASARVARSSHVTKPATDARVRFCVEVVAAEVEQRVAVLARVVARRLVGVGGEVGEVVGERARGRRAFGLAQPVEQGAHRGPAREPGRAGDAERDAAACQRRLEQRRLRVGAEEHRHAVPRHATGELVPARVGDHGGFLRVVFEHGDRARMLGRSHGARRVALDGRRRTERGFRDRDDRARSTGSCTRG